MSQNALVASQFWQFAKDLERIVPKMLMFLGKATPEGHSAVAQSTGIARRLAEAFEFVLLFDQAKMLRPEVQNDFAFYRRALSKHTHDHELTVRDDDADVLDALGTALASAVLDASQLAVDANRIEVVLPGGAVHGIDRDQLLALPDPIDDVSDRFPKRKGTAARVSALLERVLTFERRERFPRFIPRPSKPFIKNPPLHPDPIGQATAPTLHDAAAWEMGIPGRNTPAHIP